MRWYWIILVVGGAALLSCRREVIHDPNYHPPQIAHVNGTVSSANGPVSGADLHVVYELDPVSSAAPFGLRRDGRVAARGSYLQHGDAPQDCGFSYVAEAIPMNHAVRINWTVTFASNLNFFEVRRDDTMVAWFDATNVPTGHMYSYLDTSVTNGTTYYYSIFTQCLDGLQHSLPNLAVEPTNHGFDIAGYALYPNFPNPVEINTMISFDLPATAWVTLKLYNSAGQEVVALADSSYLSWWAYEMPLGMNTLANGFYGYYLTVGDAFSAHRTLLKNTRSYATLRTTQSAAVTAANGSFGLDILVGDTVQMFDNQGSWTGAAVLNRATLVAISSDYHDAVDTTLTLEAGGSHAVDLFLTQ